jgi:hypothetical protein
MLDKLLNRLKTDKSYGEVFLQVLRTGIVYFA